MHDNNWNNEAVDAEYEREDEPVSLRVYSDHRRGDLDSYPIVVMCDACAAELGGDLGGCAGPAPGQALSCEECGASNGNLSSSA
jgi:hypothetical protein